MKKLLLSFGIALLILLGLAGISPAHASNEVINSLNQQVTISQDSVATVTETIDYDFGSTSHHGIDRQFLLSTKNPEGKYYNLKFKLLGATQDGQSVENASKVSGNSYYLRIGSANSFVTGTHRYIVMYKVWPVVRHDPAGDYINYDVTGNRSLVPILKASATVTVPSGVVASDPRCYTGAQGSTAQDCTASAEANIVKVATNSKLAIGEGLTLNFLTPTGSFTQYLAASDKPLAPPKGNPFWNYVIGFGLGLAIIAIGVISRLIQLVAKRKSEKAETIIAQYSAPDGLLPAEMGVLEDLKLTMTEVTATIIDLAVRGYLKIHRVDNSKDYEFTILKEDVAGLQDYEKDLMSLFIAGAKEANGVKTLKVADISKSQASTSISKVYHKIDARLRENKFYKRPISGKSKATLGGAIGFVMVVFFGTFWIFADFSSVVWIIFPIISIFVALAISKTPGHLTKKGYDEWAKVEGLKLFLTVAEKDRLNFTDAPKMNPELFNKLLPAAIALRVEKEWAKQFEGMDMGESTGGWYDDASPITSVYLASALTSSFNSSLESSFAPPSSSGGSDIGSSSGDFGGGGFSGGGSFGGGGVGSW